MIKRFGLFFLSFIALFSVGITSADIVTHGIHEVDRCVKIVNPCEVPGYKLVMWRYSFYYGDESYEVYEIEKNKCIPAHYQGGSTWSDEFLYLIDENIDISTLNDLPLEEFESKLGRFYKLDKINPNGLRVSNSNPITNENLTYKIVNNGDNYELKLIKSGGSTALIPFTIIRFLISRIISMGVETLILFIIAKLFRKKDQIINEELILFGVLPTTITLPLLWFVLPLILGAGVRYIIVGELIVMVIEAVIIKYGLKISRGKAILASIICNLSSFSIGLIIFNNIF